MDEDMSVINSGNFDLFTVSEELDIASDSVNTPKISVIHTGDTSSDEEVSEYLTESGQEIKKKIKPKPFYEDIKRGSKSTWTGKSNKFSSCVKPCSIDSLIGIKIRNPLVSFDVLQQRMQGRKVIKMSFLEACFKRKDTDGDWVTFGVLVRKVPPKTSKNGKIYSIWKLTDLHHPDNIIGLFLFGQVHTEHWKTAVGIVVGLLNPSIMNSTDKNGEISISVDHPGKIMLVGSSKDFGHCKGRKKNGEACSMIVNLSQCEYCVYHVQKEYKKFSKRSEIQASYSGREPRFKDRLLKGPTLFYGGQSFTPLSKPVKKNNVINSKDKITLSNLTLKRKASAVFHEEKSKGVKKLAEMYGEEIMKAAEKNSDFINDKLTIPSAGSRNFLTHMMKNKASKEGNIPIVMSAKQLLKQHEQEIHSKFMQNTVRKDDSMILSNLVPQLGKDLIPGQHVSLDFSSSKSKPSLTPQDFAKMRAIKKIKDSGPIQKKDPNLVKYKPEEKKIKAALSSFEETSAVNQEESKLVRSQLGCIDLNSEKIQKILNSRSSHSYEIEMFEMEKEAAYFARLEKKEQMEEKMVSTKEIVCDVVSCKKCRYTAHNASEMCKNENHPLKCHKAIKRFYACKNCQSRTECFTRFPHKSCSNCGGSSYERTGMKRVRSGPKLDSEVLNISSDSAYFLNSL